jgi:hypothetical protein
MRTTPPTLLADILAEDVDPALLHGFLIQWSSLEVLRHEATERFLVAASRGCAVRGEAELALTLLRLASEAIHAYRRLADDRRALVELWNLRSGHVEPWARSGHVEPWVRRRPTLDLTTLLTQPPSPGVERCHAHQLELALGPAPWTELAAVYEVQGLLAAIAPRLVALALAKLGEAAAPGLTSLRALADHGDSALAHAMARVLAAHPQWREAMVLAGSETLDHYAEFLRECMVGGFHLSSWQARQHA